MNKLTDKQRTIAIAVAAVLGVLILGWILVPDVMAGIVLFVVIAVVVVGVVAAWLTPVWIAVKRDHPSKGGIIAVNLLLGWTFLGWVIALVWALSNNNNGATTVVVNNGGFGGVQATTGPITPQYQIGDVANGHRWNGQEWVPVAQVTAAAHQSETEIR